MKRRLRFVLAILLLGGGCSGSGSATPAQPDGPSTTRPAATTAERGRWRPMAPLPFPPAGGMATAWTGSLLVAWGGQPAGGGEATASGAAYDPAADRWTVLPSAPLRGRFGATAVWTGREVLFWGGQGGLDTTFADGAAYDPARRQWRLLPAAPVGPRTGHQAVWTGTEMVVWGGSARCCQIDSVLHDTAAAAFDPAADRWRPIAAVPPPWSGGDGSAVTVTDGERPLIWRRGRLVAHDPAADRWVEVPGAPPLTPTPGAAPAPATPADPFALGAVTGGKVFTWVGSLTGPLDGMAYRPAPAQPAPSASTAGTWRRTAPLDAQYGAVVTAGGPGRIYAAAGQSARVLEYRIDEDRWEELPDLPVRTRSGAVLVWTGTELIVWGGNGDEGPEGDGARWHCC